MAYVIRALLLTTPAVAALSAIRPDMTVADLGQGLNLLHLSPSRLQEFGTNAEVFEAGEDGKFDDYTIGIAEILERIARQGDAAFVGAEFHGGSGTQWAIVHSANHATQAIKGTDAINQALRQLGVARVPPSDEFETVNLGRFEPLRNGHHVDHPHSTPGQDSRQGGLTDARPRGLETLKKLG